MREVVIRSADDVHRLRTRLANPRGVLPALGELLVSEAVGAFQEQRFGGTQWPERYEGTDGPFVNVAGALEDLASAPRVKARRFDRRPAGMDKGFAGGLVGSVAARVVSDTEVEVGSAMEYAAAFQFGGTSTQAVTDEARENLAEWLRTEEGAPFRDRMGFLFQVPELVTHQHARPFLGVTDAIAHDLVRAVEVFVAGEGAGG